MSKEIILAIDPGEHTGWAIGDTTSEIYDYGVYKIPERKKSFVELYELLMNKVEEFNVSIVVIEGIVTTGYMYKGVMLALRIIGMLQFMADFNKLEYVMQMPNVKKPYVKEVKEMLAGTKGVTEHEKDAICHFLSYIDKKNKK